MKSGALPLLFNQFSQPLDEHVVAPAGIPFRADGDIVALQLLGEFQAGELVT